MTMDRWPKVDRPDRASKTVVPSRPAVTKPPSHIGFRLAISLFVILLAGQCVWLLLPQLSQPAIDRLPTDPASAAAAADHRGAAEWAAAMAVIRGDLWAESAYTYAGLLWNHPDANVGQALAKARASLNSALNDAPHESGAWLLFAALDMRYPSPGPSATAALKMSYYTGPTDRNLMPLRFALAADTEFVGDFEMRQFITRDLRLLLARHDMPVIRQAYIGASAAERHFIEQAVDDIDPSALPALRASAQPPQLPN